ncbi:hypothetical protein PAHAL_2G063100 [Panicum hallii]|uniref:Uncharacterized protein n=1 Tax=Panicum hallii TaxID=206008 RepID=A0A2T8KN46_9POAL|nr:hypothetical protein PAHAL_2G063100 [Panicum hallii]
MASRPRRRTCGRYSPTTRSRWRQWNVRRRQRLWLPLPCRTDAHLTVAPLNSSDTSCPSRGLSTKPSPSGAPSASSSSASRAHAGLRYAFTSS